MDEYVKEHGFLRANLAGPNGMSMLDSVDFSQQGFFQQVMSSREPVISDPVYSTVTGELVVTVAAPLWRDGKPGTQVVGVVIYVADGMFLSELVRNIQVGESGSAYMVDAEGTTIAYDDEAMIQQRYSTQEEAKNDAPIKGCVTRLQQVVAGDLTSPVPEVRSRDEVGVLAGSTRELVEGLRQIIGASSLSSTIWPRATSRSQAGIYAITAGTAPPYWTPCAPCGTK